MSHEPTRLVDLRDAPSPEAAFMGGVLRAHRPLRPSPGKMDELAGRLGPILEDKSAPVSRATPWIGVAILAIVLSAGVLWIARPTTEKTTGAEPAPAQVEPPAPSPPSSPATISVDVRALPNASASATAAAKAYCNEVDLVERADAKLREGDAAGALAVTREHEQRCPAGALAQERERIAVEALAKLGRVEAARERVRAFEARFSSSPHLRRMRQVAGLAL